MSEQKITNETIDLMVGLVETAETQAETHGLSVAATFAMMMKMMQRFQDSEGLAKMFEKASKQ